MTDHRIKYGDFASYESSVDPSSDASIDELLFGMKSDRGSNVSISSNISMEDVTKATSLINLTHANKNNDSENVDDDTSASRQVAGNLTIRKNILKFLKFLKFLKDIRGLIKCPISYKVMLDPFMGTDHQSCERDEISQWLRETSISPVSRQPIQMHCLKPDYTMRRMLSVFEDR